MHSKLTLLHLRLRPVLTICLKSAQAAKLYRGEFLADAGVSDRACEDWRTEEARRLQTAAEDALTKLQERATVDADWPAAKAAAERLLELDPLREDAHRSLMRTQAALGQRATALRQYQTCCDLLKTELGIAPDAMTEQLHQEILLSDAVPNMPDGVIDDTATAKKIGARPSIAVLPFTNMSGDPEQEYFSDGITEEIITTLSKLRWFLVIARNSTFVYKGPAR